MRFLRHPDGYPSAVFFRHGCEEIKVVTAAVPSITRPRPRKVSFYSLLVADTAADLHEERRL
jgi:hypothetical protein